MKIPRYKNILRMAVTLPFAAFGFLLAGNAQAEVACDGDPSSWPTYTANVVVFDTPMVFNRLGAQNPNWIMYALKRDVVNINNNSPLTVAGAAMPGRVQMRPDKRPRPLSLRLPRCSKLKINFQNLLANPANPVENLGDLDEKLEQQGLECVNNGDGIDKEAAADACAQRAEGGFPFVTIGDNQVKTRYAGVHVAGMQLDAANGIANDSSNVGANGNSCVAQGGYGSFTFLAEHEGAFKLSNPCAATGGEATGGNNGLGMWGMVTVQPKGARIYRSQVYEEEYRLASDLADYTLDGTYSGYTANGHPIIDYEARYPNQQPWISEGKANLPILNMNDCYGTSCEIVHSEVNAIVVGPEDDGTFPISTYPLESAYIRNPTVPNRLEPFRDWSQMWHDESAATQAFEGFFEHPVVGHTLHGVRDAFMINYGSGGIGSEIIANRLGVGPMYDCLGCAYEEFFLTSFTVGDPGMRVDVPANFGLENVSPEDVAAQIQALVPLIGPKSTTALFQDDPANIHNSYVGDFAKFRNVHMGPKEQHVFHLHNHQWLFNANDDRANYLDAQGIGPGSSYTYEINFGGSGNRNKTAGDAIFHCHFYPHFAQGMWYHWRIHDVTETGTILAASLDGGVNPNYHDTQWALGNSQPALQADVNAAFGMSSAQYVDLMAVGLDPITTRHRAHPDGEILAGVPISAVVPMPGKPMAPMPGDVVLVTKDSDGDGAADSSQNYVVERDVNPGYPFWIAGLDCSNGVDGVFDPTCAQAVVGQRPPSPPLDMISQAEAEDLLVNDPFYAGLLAADAADGTGKYADAFVNAAGGFDGGLPRHAIGGCKDASVPNLGNPDLPLNGAVVSCAHAPNLHAVGPLFESSETRLDFHKEVLQAKGVIYPEAGTDLEKVAMAAHATREQATSKIMPDGSVVDDGYDAVKFVLNGLPPVPGAPYNDPCVSDTGQALVGGGSYDFFGSGQLGSGAADEFFQGPMPYGRAWDEPFTYAAANIQIDAVFNKVGYHYPQQRIIALWGDVLATINKERAPEPFVMRLNTFNCAKYQHSNLVPKEFEVDDYQVRTPTDIIGQHIHLPKWDLTTADGAANGWNYEDGTLATGMVRERIEAINHFNDNIVANGLPRQVGVLNAEVHPVLGGGAGGEWNGARVTLQRWFVDPVVDRDEVDRGLGIVFTHDHYGPSTFQQIGLYSTLLAEPAESTWVHNETGVALGTRQANCGDPNPGCDGGPTSWQAAILPPADPQGELAAVLGDQKPFREFYLEFSDFQHAYEAGVYVGAGPDGRPFVGGAGTASHDANGINVAFPVTADTFRHAINPSVREEAICKNVAGSPPECNPDTPLPDIVRFPSICGIDGMGNPVLRPCPEAISADDPGMLVVNYRNDPIGLRVFDPFALGPDGNPGTQTAGFGGDLAFALATPPLLGPDGNSEIAGQPPANAFRAIPQMNFQPVPGLAGGLAVGDNLYPPNESGLPTIRTTFPDSENGGSGVPYNLQAALIEGDPYVPLMRVFPGDQVRLKIQAGAHEHEHNATVHGVKWMQGNSGHGPVRPSGGWRNSQNAGISEQFNFEMPLNSDPQAKQPHQYDDRRGADHLYTVDAAQDGWWSGTWGLLRSYTGGAPAGAPLFQLPGGFHQAPAIDNRREFAGVCPRDGNRPQDPPKNLRQYDVIAVAANEILDNQLGATLTGNLPLGSDVLHVGGPVDPDGGTLVYNPRGGVGANPDAQFDGPLHDPTSLLFVLAEDLEPLPGQARNVCRDNNARPGVANPPCQVKLKDNAPLEPLTLRARAGDCVEVRLFNRLKPEVPDLAGFNTLLQMVIRDRRAEFQAPELTESVTTFNNNLIRPSSYVGLHAQMVEYDITQHDGVVAGGNVAGGAVVGPVEGDKMPGAPFNAVTYRWYAGDVTAVRAGNRVELVATPTEFGGSTLTPADKVKQGQKAMIGALIIEPEDATWPGDALAGSPEVLEQVRNRQDGGASYRGTRTDMTVTYNGGYSQFEDLVLAKQSGLNHRHKDGRPVPNIAGEGGNIPEDSHDAGQKGANFGTEPAWFRFGLPANIDFGNDDTGLGAVDAEKMFANALAGDQYPWTPVFTAPKGKEARMRVLHPTGGGRGSTFDLHGHVWARDPYLPEGGAGCLTAPSGLGDGRTPLAVGGTGCGLSSVKIGDNPLAWYLGGQESWTPMGHFDVVLPKAGGRAEVTGDYLFRDHGSFGVTDGIWGIMRVQ